MPTLVPSSVPSSTGWTASPGGTNLVTALSDASTTTYLGSSANGDVLVVELSNPSDTGSRSGTCSFSVEALEANGDASIEIVVVEGTPAATSGGATRATSGVLTLTTTPTTYTVTVDSSQITNFDNLYLRIFNRT